MVFGITSTLSLMKIFAHLLLTALLFQTQPLLAQVRHRATNINSGHLKQISQRMQESVSKGRAAGIVTLVAHQGKIVSLNACGVTDLETKAPMQADTIFHIASMTKPIVAVGIMMLLEEGRLSITDPVAKHLPEFAHQKVKVGGSINDQFLLRVPSRPVSIRDLMTHTSGMSGNYPPEYGDFFQFFSERKPTLAEAVATFARMPLEFEPGAKWQYSNTGIATLGRIIEVASGKPFDQLMSERIFQPLGMKDTHFFLPESKRSRVATIYNLRDGRLHKADLDLFRPNARYPSPEAGLYSTAADLFRFYQMMLNGGTLNEQRILSEASVKLMTSNHTGELKAGFQPGVGFGLGWYVVRNQEGMFRLNSVGTYGHGGLWKTHGFIDPKKQLVGILLMQRNSSDGDLSDELNAFSAIAESAF
jgi:CubicO group peptidase (beta-lactamase class C family)